MHVAATRATRAAMRMRRLSTAAATASAAEPAAQRGIFFPTVGFLVAAGGGSTAAAWLGGDRYASDGALREQLRRDRPELASWIESALKENAPPAWSQAIRIHDDAVAQGIDPGPSSIAFGPATRYGFRGASFDVYNVGCMPLLPAERSENGKAFWSRLHGETLKEDEPAAAAVAPAADAKADNVARNPVVGVHQEYGPVPPDDEADDGVTLDDDELLRAEGAHASRPFRHHSYLSIHISSLLIRLRSLSAGAPADWASRSLRERATLLADSGGPDGAAWGDAWAQHWAAAPPPERPTRLRVPEAAARRYHDALRRYAALLNPHAEPAEPAAPPASSSGLRLIALPDEFLCDGEYGRAGGVGGDRPTEESRRLRLSWLRVQETFASAELEAVEAQSLAARKSSTWWRSEGGGAAVQRMGERARRLHARLADLRWEKDQVKRAAAFAVEEEWRDGIVES